MRISLKIMKTYNFFQEWLSIYPKDSSIAQRFDIWIQDRSIRMFRVQFMSLFTCQGMLSLYLTMLISRLVYDLQNHNDLTPFAVFFAQTLAYLFGMTFLKRFTSIYMFLFTVSFNYYQVIMFQDTETGNSPQASLLNGERLSIMSIIPILYIKEGFAAFSMIIIDIIFRYVKFSNVAYWELVAIAMYYLLLLGMRVIDRRTLCAQFFTSEELSLKNEGLSQVIETSLPDGLAIIRKRDYEVIFENATVLTHLLCQVRELDFEQQAFMDESIKDAQKYSLKDLINQTSGNSRTYQCSPELAGTVFRITRLGVSVSNSKWRDEEASIVRFFDLTEHDKAIEIQAGEKSRDKAIATVSHELRTPLNAILGMLNSLCYLKLREEEKNIVDICIHSGKMLLNLINSILDYGQIKANKITFHYSYFDLNDFLEEIQMILKALVQAKGLQLKINIFPTVPNKIFTDKTRLKQIIINLIGNAIKFTQKGSVTITVDKDEAINNMIQFSIIDTGVGIKPEKIATLFQDYGRIDEHEDINKSGVGLGLSISQALVKALSNGIDKRGIRVSSELGMGSTFAFSILNQNPFEMSTEINSKELDQILNPPDEGIIKFNPNVYNLDLMNNHNKKQSNDESNESERLVMLVEDNPFNQMVISAFLRTSYQLDPILANNGKECLEIIEKFPLKSQFPRIILLDCVMPIMDGFETAKILRSKMNRSEIPNIVIVALTANTVNEARENCIAAGMDYCLSKPISPMELEPILYKVGINNKQQFLINLTKYIGIFIKVTQMQN